MTDVERLQIVRKIGSGGMGEVFHAVLWEDGGFHRDVVVKRLHPHLSSDPNLVKALRDEATLQAKVGHPGVPQVLSFRSAHSSWLIVMDHIAGVSLEKLRKEASDGFTVAECILLTHRLAETVAAVHAAGVLHGDISPANILIDTQSRPRLIDFGIATTAEMREHTSAKGVRGSVGYIAPEVLRNDLVDERADIFSLGCVLYECVQGDRMFPTQHMQYRDMVLNGSIHPLWQVAAECPEALSDAIMTCLERDPNDRFPTVQAMLNSLAPLISATDPSRAIKTLAQRLTKHSPEPESQSQEAPACCIALPTGNKMATPVDLVPDEVHQDVLDGLDEFLDEPNGKAVDDLDELLSDLSEEILPAMDGEFSLVTDPPPKPPPLHAAEPPEGDIGTAKTETPAPKAPDIQPPQITESNEGRSPGVYFMKPAKPEKP